MSVAERAEAHAIEATLVRHFRCSKMVALLHSFAEEQHVSSPAMSHRFSKRGMQCVLEVQGRMTFAREVPISISLTLEQKSKSGTS